MQVVRAIVGPTGNTVIGDVLDVNKAALERALRAYDSQLYIKWNPKKRRGQGIWELRRHPNTKYAVYKGSHAGINYYNLEYQETDIVHHVKDMPFLNYDVINWLKRADTWQDRQWILSLENSEKEYKEKQQAKVQEELRYNLKQQRTAIRQLKEELLSGINPDLLGYFWGKQGP